MGGTIVVVTGANFPMEAGELPSVTVGGSGATEISVLSPSSLRLKLPASTRVGPVDVVVSSPRGGTGTLSQGFTFTNDLPTVVIEPLSTTQTLNLVFGVTLSDSESDRIDIALDYSVGGGAYQPIPSAQILSGGTQGLASSPTGVTHNLTWASSTLFNAQNAGQVRIRATPTDTSDGQVAAAAESNPFSIVNNLAPSLVVSAPANDSFEVAVSYRVADPNPGASLTLTGATWRDANSGASGNLTIKSGSPAAVPGAVTGSVGGTNHSLVWDSFKDLSFGNNRLVEVTLTLSDGTQTISATSGTFFVSNGPLSDGDINPANLVQLKAFAIGDLNGDGRADAFATTDLLRSISLLLSNGQTFQSPIVTDLLGLPLPHGAAAIGWDGTTSLTVSGDTSGLQVGDWLSLPYVFGANFGDPIGPRSFRIASIGATITIEDPDNYLGSDLLPGSASLGGPVPQVFGMTQRQAARPGLAAANLPNDFRPGEVAILSVDENLSAVTSVTSDVVIANAAPSQLVTATTLVAGAVFTVSDVSPIPYSSQAFLAGMRVLLQQGATTEQATILSVDVPANRITLRAAPAASFTPGTFVFSLTSSSFPLINEAGHAKNHSLIVLPQVGGTIGAPSQVIATGARFTSDLIAVDIAGPAGGPDGVLDLVVISQATANATSTKGAASVLVRDTAGTGFRPPLVIETGTGGMVPAGSAHGTVADVTSDGLPDIVVANQGESSITIIAQNPASPGTFLPATTISLSSFMIPNGDTHSVAVADFDQDGYPDLAVGGALTQRVLFFRGADPDGGGPAISFPGGNPAAPTLLVTQSPPPPPLVAGQPSSQPAPFFFVGVGPGRFCAGDLNGDGRPDLVVTENVQNRATAFMNLGSAGGFLGFNAVPLTTSLGPVDLAIQDVSGDGRADLLVAGSLLGDISRFQALVPGTLDRFVSFPVGPSPQGLLVVDLTPDIPGMEVVSVNNGDSSLTILGRDGAGGLQPLSPFVGQRDVPVEAQDKSTLSPTPSTGSLRLLAAISVSSGDMNGDGRPDLVVFTQSSTEGVAGAAVLLNEGGVAPIRTTTRVMLARFPGLSGGVAQVVSDSNPDVIFVEFLSATSGALNIFRGVGGTNFAASTIVPLALPSTVTVVDLDGDLDSDLLAPLNAGVPSNFAVLLQEPAGDLSAPTGGVTGGVQLPGFTGVSFAIAADLNNDGLKDVAFTNFHGSRLAVAYQNNPPVNPPRFDRVVEVLSLLQPASITIGDLNSDGLVDMVAVFSGDDQIGVYYQRPGTNKAPALALEGPILLPTGPAPFGAQVVDVNGDGRVDLAVTSRGASTVDVFFQR